MRGLGLHVDTIAHFPAVAAGVGYSVQLYLSACMSVCLFVCQHSRRKTPGAIDTKLGKPIAHDRISASNDPEVKRSKVKVRLILYRLHWLWH